MTTKDMISILKELPEDIRIERASLKVKKLEDFRRLILLYGAEVYISRSKFPDESGIDWIFCWFCSDDFPLKFCWEGRVSGYTVQWCDHEGNQQQRQFETLEDANLEADELRKQYDGVVVLPGADSGPGQD